jgi:hypothetical protein
VPLGVDDLQRADGFARQPFAVAYDLLTFGPNLPAVQAFLQRTGVPANLTVLTNQVTEASLRELQRLARGRRACVLTHERYTNVMEWLLREHSSLAPEDVRVVVVQDGTDLAEAARGADVVVYNSALHEAIASLGRPELERIEMVFELSTDSVRRLRRSYLPGTT